MLILIITFVQDFFRHDYEGVNCQFYLMWSDLIFFAGYTNNSLNVPLLNWFANV